MGKQGEADPHGRAVDRGDERLVERLERLQQGGEAGVDVLARGQAGHLVQVLAGGERPAGTGQHGDLHAVVGPGAVKRGGGRPVQRRVERVEGGGPIEGEEADGAEVFDPDERI